MGNLGRRQLPRNAQAQSDLMLSFRSLGFQRLNFLAKAVRSVPAGKDRSPGSSIIAQVPSPDYASLSTRSSSHGCNALATLVSCT